MATAVKTLQDIPALGVASTDAMCERLLSFLAAYQAQNNGATPGWAVIANQLGIIEEGVRPLVAKLENQGRIFIASRNPLHILLSGKNPAEPSEADTAAVKPGAYDRFLDAEAERMRLARFVGDTERTKGRGPSLREMIDFVGWAEPRRVNRMAEMLAEKGLLQFGRGVPTKLTELGRQVLGMRPAQKGVGEMEQTKPKAVVIVPKSKKPVAGQVDAFCEALAKYKRAVGDEFNPPFEWFCVQLGYGRGSQTAVSHIADAAIEAGYIAEPGKTGRFRYRGSGKLQFTEKGRAKFMPETIGEGMPSGEPVRYEERGSLAAVSNEQLAPTMPPIAKTVVETEPQPNGGLDFGLSTNGLRVKGGTNSRTELAAFIGKLGALMPFLGE